MSQEYGRSTRRSTGFHIRSLLESDVLDGSRKYNHMQIQHVVWYACVIRGSLSHSYHTSSGIAPQVQSNKESHKTFDCICPYVSKTERKSGCVPFSLVAAELYRARRSFKSAEIRYWAALIHKLRNAKHSCGQGFEIWTSNWPSVQGPWISIDCKKIELSRALSSVGSSIISFLIA